MSGSGKCTVEGCQGQFRLSTPASPVCSSCFGKGYRGYPPKLKEGKMSDRVFWPIVALLVVAAVIWQYVK